MEGQRVAVPGDVHVWFRCHGCGMAPIIGACYQCESCFSGPERELCSECHERFMRGELRHPPPDMPSSLIRVHRFAPLRGVPAERYAPWLQVSGKGPSPAPQVRSGLLVRLEFCRGRQSSFGSYGFTVASNAGTLVVTALHVMDELLKGCGIDASVNNPHYSGRELPEVLSDILLYDVLQVRWMLHPMGRAERMLVLPDARIGEPEPYCSRDIAAFVARTNASLRPAPLAEDAPEVGETIWLAACYDDGAHTKAAVVVEKTAVSFVFRYQDAKVPLRYGSGAPLLDRAGKVVGINTGLGFYGGRCFGHANHVGSMRKHLAACLS